MRVYPVKREARKIEVQNIRLHHVRLPLCEPFRISNGEVTEKEAILVEIKTAAGVTGWGESSPMSGSFYSGETPEGSWRVLIEKLLPLVLERPRVEPKNFYQVLKQI